MGPIIWAWVLGDRILHKINRQTCGGDGDSGKPALYLDRRLAERVRPDMERVHPGCELIEMRRVGDQD